MTDYEKLVKALRTCVNTEFCNECSLFDTCENDNKLKLDAADAIKDLQAQLEYRTNAVELWNDMYAIKHLPQDEKDKILEYIRNAPIRPIEPIRIEQLSKRGKWLPYEFCTDGTWHKCSVCGVAYRYKDPDEKRGIELVINHKYCPNCGAKMMEVQDGDD